MEPYTVINLDEYRERKGQEAASEGNPGRPRKYDGPTKSVSFRVPVEVRKEGRRKAKAHKFNMTALLAAVYRLFCLAPVPYMRDFQRGVEEMVAHREQGREDEQNVR